MAMWCWVINYTKEIIHHDQGISHLVLFPGYGKPWYKFFQKKRYLANIIQSRELNMFMKPQSAIVGLEFTKTSSRWLWLRNVFPALIFKTPVVSHNLLWTRKKWNFRTVLFIVSRVLDEIITKTSQWGFNIFQIPTCKKENVDFRSNRHLSWKLRLDDLVRGPWSLLIMNMIFFHLQKHEWPFIIHFDDC